MKNKYKQQMQKLLRKNPNRAYYLDLSRQLGILLLAIPYFLGVVMMLIGLLVRPFNWLIGWGMISFGSGFFLIALLACILNNIIYRKRMIRESKRK